MIKFKNISGDMFLAVGSIKRKSTLNGEKSLSGTLFKGDDVLNKIDKGWSLEFDNEPYVVTYFERNDNDNTVEFDAIHKFFWDMNKSVLYLNWSGSHTAKAYLEQVFQDTGYRYALNFEPGAFEKENWGMKNKLSLFNDVIDSIGGEFEINGTLVSIFKNIGSDLSTIVRHGFNLSDMSLENDNTDFVTYGEGFGAYADQENQKGDRLHVTYTSPLAKTFGKLHAEPVDDQRYTVKDNLLQAIKDKVDGSFAVSIKLSLYDLTAAGYPYKMANVGDWLLAVDENLDFKQKIRIISVDDELAADGTRISYTVTCGDVGVVQKYQQANASLGQKVQSAYENAQAAKDSSTQAVIAANGKNTNYYVDSLEELEAIQANEGDLGFVQTGDGKAMYVYTKMPDGSFKWVKRVDPDTGEQIATGVDLAIETAQSQADAMDEERAKAVAEFESEANAALSEAASERNSLSIQADTMLDGANSYADSMADSAAAYGKAQASNVLSQAQSELSVAKQQLGSEVSKAQADITATNTQLAGKVSQADFNKATGDLSTQYGQVKATADAVKTDVAKYKETNDKNVSANAASIATMSDQIESKVSQADYDANKQAVNSSLSEFKQRADGFEATVTKVDNLSVGSRNLILDSDVILKSNGSSQAFSISLDDEYLIGMEATLSFRVYYNKVVGLPSDGKNRLQANLAYENTDGDTKYLAITYYPKYGEVINERFSKTFTIPDGAANMRANVSIQGVLGTTGGVHVGQPKLELGNVATDWTPAPEDTDTKVAAVKVDVDKITGLVNDPKSGLSATATLAANGMSVATKAQNDATTAIQTAKGIQTQVTSNDGEIKNLQSKQTQTAGQITQEVNDRKSGDSTLRMQLRDYIGTQVSSVTSGYKSAIEQSANGIILGLSQPNRFFNTQFTPDLAGWQVTNNATNGNSYNFHRSYVASGDTTVCINIPSNAGSDSSEYRAYFAQDVAVPGDNSNTTFSLTWDVRTVKKDKFHSLWIIFKNSKHETINSDLNISKYWSDDNVDGEWHTKKVENIQVPKEAKYVRVSFQAREGSTAYLKRPMFVFRSSAADYMPGSYSGINESTVLELFKDNWALGIANNSGKLISGINGDTSGVTITGKQLTLDGNTTVTGDFYAKGGNFKNLNASNITTGTINASDINIINMNASNIVSGTLTGVKIRQSSGSQTQEMSNGSIKSYSSGNLTTNLGQYGLEFYNGEGDKVGSFEPTSRTSDNDRKGLGITVDSGFFSLGHQYNGERRAAFRTGRTVFDLGGGKSRTVNQTLVSGMYDNRDDSIRGAELFLGANAMYTVPNENTNYKRTQQPSMLFRNHPASSSDGNSISMYVGGYGLYDKQYFDVLKNHSGNTNAERILFVSEDSFRVKGAYSTYSTLGTNMLRVNEIGELQRTSSSRRYKLLEEKIPLEKAKKFLEIDAKDWYDKQSCELAAKSTVSPQNEANIDLRRTPGLIAEDMQDVGLEEFLSFDEEGKPNGINTYTWVLMQPIVKQHEKEINELKSKISELENRL